MGLLNLLPAILPAVIQAVPSRAAWASAGDCQSTAQEHRPWQPRRSTMPVRGKLTSHWCCITIFRWRVAGSATQQAESPYHPRCLCLVARLVQAVHSICTWAVQDWALTLSYPHYPLNKCSLGETHHNCHPCKMQQKPFGHCFVCVQRIRLQDYVWNNHCKMDTRLKPVGTNCRIDHCYCCVNLEHQVQTQSYLAHKSPSMNLLKKPGNSHMAVSWGQNISHQHVQLGPYSLLNISCFLDLKSVGYSLYF